MIFLPPETPLSRACSAALATAPGSWEVVVAADADSARRELGEADAAFGTMTPDLLAASPRLAWLQAPAAGPPAGYYFPELVAHPAVVTNLRGVYADHVATHALALMLHFARNLHRYARYQVTAEWRPEPTRVRHLPDSTVVIVGAGAIGQELARLLTPFGCSVVGVDADHTAPLPGFDEVRPSQDLDLVLPRADFAVLTVPHTPQTAGLMDARRLALMPPSAVLVNVGRGPTVVLDAATAALAAGTIAGLALDVAEVEPLPPEHPLWRQDGAVITPHVGVNGPYLIERRTEVFLDNARRFRSGEPLRNLVDKARWY